MSKDWFSPSDLLGLVAIPSSAQGIRYKASNENWLKRKRVGQGGGHEYHISSLPQETQQYIAKQAAEAFAKAETNPARSARQLVVEMERKEEISQEQKRNNREQGLAKFNGLSEKSQNRAHAKLLILKTYEAYIAPYRNVSREIEGLDKFVAEYKEHALDLPEWVYSNVKKISRKFKYQWQSVLENGGLSALAGNYTSTRGKSVISGQPEVEQFLQALLVKKPHLAHKGQEVHKSLVIMQATDYPQWQIPSVSAVARWVKSWIKRHSAEFSYVTNPDAYNSKHRPLFGHAYMHQQLESPNDIWEFDSTPVDAMLKGSVIALVLSGYDLYYGDMNLIE